MDKRFCSRSCATSYLHKEHPGKVGYQKGELNIAKRPSIRRKISKGVMASYDDPTLLEKRAKAYAALGARADSYRSEQEKQFAEFLQEAKVGYLREHAQGYMALKGKKLVRRQKVIDFVLPQHNIYIELTGFIWGSTDTSQRTYFRERLLELSSLSPENTYIVSSTSDKVLSRVRECFDGWTPWNMKEMKAGNNLLILSYSDLQTYIMQRSNT